MTVSAVKATFRHLSRVVQGPSSHSMATLNRTLFTCATRWRSTDDNNNNKTPANNKNEADDESPMTRLIKERLGNLEEIENDNVDPFRLFNLPRQFAVKMHAVQKEMLKLQRILHPDRHMSSNLDTQFKAGHLSALVNSQYRIISDPYERAKCLLAITTRQSPQELELELEQSSKVDPIFLERMMELSETVESEGGKDIMLLSSMHAQVGEELQELLGNLDTEFKARNFAKVKGELAKLKFLSNLFTKLTTRIESSSNSSGNF